MKIRTTFSTNTLGTYSPPKRKKEEEDSRPRLLQTHTHIRTPLLRVPNHKNAFQTPKTCISFTFNTDDFFSSVCSPLSFSYDISLFSFSLLLKSFADLLLLLRLMLFGAVCWPSAWFRIVSILPVGTTKFFFFFYDNDVDCDGSPWFLFFLCFFSLSSPPSSDSTSSRLAAAAAELLRQ